MVNFSKKPPIRPLVPKFYYKMETLMKLIKQTLILLFFFSFKPLAFSSEAPRGFGGVGHGEGGTTTGTGSAAGEPAREEATATTEVKAFKLPEGYTLDFSKRLERAKIAIIGATYSEGDILKWGALDSNYIGVASNLGNEKQYIEGNPIKGDTKDGAWDWDNPGFWKKAFIEALQSKKFERIFIDIGTLRAHMSHKVFEELLIFLKISKISSSLYIYDREFKAGLTNPSQLLGTAEGTKVIRQSMKMRNEYLKILKKYTNPSYRAEKAWQHLGDSKEVLVFMEHSFDPRIKGTRPPHDFFLREAQYFLKNIKYRSSLIIGDSQWKKIIRFGNNKNGELLGEIAPIAYDDLIPYLSFGYNPNEANTRTSFLANGVMILNDLDSPFVVIFSLEQKSNFRVNLLTGKPLVPTAEGEWVIAININIKQKGHSEELASEEIIFKFKVMN